MLDSAIIILLVFALISANLPWLTERRFFLFRPPQNGRKSIWMCLSEWFVMLWLWALLAFGMEKKLLGEIHSQDWEFYTVLICLYAVFALPGFIYRYDLSPHLEKRKRRLK